MPTKTRQRKNTQQQTDADDLKIPPHSIDAERSVLGGLMIDDQVWDTVVTKLKEKDFYRYEHRLIFRAMEDLAKRENPFDIITVVELLKAQKALDNAGGESYLFELSSNTPSVANIVAYADIVREKSVLRQLIATANRIADSAFNTQGRTVDALLDEAEGDVFAIAEQTSNEDGPQRVSKLLAKATERIKVLQDSDEAITGLATGFSDFDDMTSGLQPADLVIVAGRPSMGKTAFAMNIAEHAIIKNQKPVLIFSMEMPADSLATRILSSLGRIDQHHLRTGKLADEDWPSIMSAVGMLADLPLFVDDTPSLSPAEIRGRARRIARESGQLGLIVVDYLQLMRVPGFRVENRTAEISEISRSLKSLAKELNVPVIALSQLNRSLEQRSDRRPVMSDLRESGAIEQDADVIAFIYRDEVYNEDSSDKGTAEIIIAKQRNGPIGKIRLTFLGKYTRFEDLAYEGYQDGVS